jgi:hypothetical protein
MMKNLIKEGNLKLVYPLKTYSTFINQDQEFKTTRQSKIFTKLLRYQNKISTLLCIKNVD